MNNITNESTLPKAGNQNAIPVSIAEIARAYNAAGLCVIPVRSDGSKRPVGLWDEYKSRQSTTQEIRRWFGPNRGLGIVCGAVSGNLEVIDFDEASLYEPWCEIVDGIAPGLRDRLTVHKTPNGWHVIYRCLAVGGSTKLASDRTHEHGANKKSTLIETRGEGAQILVPECVAECHESGRQYVHAAGPPITMVANISPEERAILIRAAFTFDKSGTESTHCRPFDAPEGTFAAGEWQLRPGDEYNDRTSWPEVLQGAGWKPINSSKGVTYWQRPGKTGSGASATTGHCGDHLYVFSSNAHPFEQDKAYSKFSAYTVLNHCGDFKAAAKQLAEAGYGKAAPGEKNLSGAVLGDTFRAYRAPPRPWPDPLHPRAFHGLTGELVRRIEPHSEADPAALLIQFLVAFGSVIGRTAYFMAESTRHYLNLFAVLVGATAKGRKGSSWSNILHVSRTVDEIWSDARVLTGLSSGEGLIWNVRDPIFKREAIKEKGRVIDYEEVKTDPGVADKRLLVVEPEFANVFKVAGREGNTLSPIIRLAWDTGMLQSLVKNSPAKATGAHISLIGHITDEELRRTINETEKANGFANRFLWFCVRRSKLLPEGGGFHNEPIGDLVETLRKSVIFSGAVGEMTRDAEARSLWHREYARLSEGQPGMLGAILGRAEAQVMRLACIYALLDMSVTIRVKHLEAALAAWDYCERSARFIFGGSLGDGGADETMALLRRHPDGVTRQGIHDAFNRHRTKSDIERALATLETAGLARFEKRESGGRPSEVWFFTDANGAESALSAERPAVGVKNSLTSRNAQPLPPQYSDLGHEPLSSSNDEVEYLV